VPERVELVDAGLEHLEGAVEKRRLEEDG